MRNALRRLSPCLMFLALGPIGCHAQTSPAPTAGRLSPELERRIEVLIRSRSNVPPNYSMEIGPATKSEIPGYQQVTVSFSADGKTSKPVRFLLSDDHKSIAQFTSYDISADPRAAISDGGRPARGGPESAPVTIVGFDDLECPFCARLHTEIFPALLKRYGNQVHFVYKDYPLPMHPWAMRAAVDVNCLAAQSTAGYWGAVDHIHEHAGELGGAEKSLAVANNTLDAIVRDEGKQQHVDETKLNACIAKQDETAIHASMQEGEALGIGSTPMLYINGEKFEGAYPLADLYRMIDGALVAQGKTPPPAPPAQAPADAGTPANKPVS